MARTVVDKLSDTVKVSDSFFLTRTCCVHYIDELRMHCNKLINILFGR